MKGIAISIIVLAVTIFSGCNEVGDFKIGYTTPGVPISVSISSSGNVGMSVGRRFVTPIGTFSLNGSIPQRLFSSHSTKIIIRESTKSTQYFFELLAGESFNYADNYRTDINITERFNSTVVTIESQELDHFLKVARVKDPKPQFPESPLPNFWLTKKINVDWTVNSIGDFLLNIIYCVIYLFTITIDLWIMAGLFLIRLVWFLIIGLFYIIGSMF